MERRTRQSSSIKRQKYISIDRLGALPDDVICHILSFLSIKQTVATSILSKRWRFLWAYVTNLDIDSGDHEISHTTSFSSIIHRVMALRRVQTINTFRLNYEHVDCSTYEIETWIAAAILRNVQNLDIWIEDQFMLPKCIFTSETLVDLCLQNCRGIPSSGVVFLPSLKKLGLYCVEYQVKESLPHLLSGCPVLDELIIQEVEDQDLNCFKITSPTIKSLSLDINNDHVRRMKINAPVLTYLRVYDGYNRNFTFPHLTSLVEADICLDKNMLEKDYFYALSVSDILDSLRNVKHLQLSCDYNEEFLDMTMVESRQQINRFDNLTKLKLAAHWIFLTKILEIADNLEVLILYKVDKDLKRWMEPNGQVPKCLLSHLGTVTIHQFECTEDEFNMVRYLLGNSKVLKRIEIKYSQQEGIDFKAKVDVLQRISSFKPGSEECELVLG